MHKLEKIWLGLGMFSLVFFLIIIGIGAFHSGHQPAASGREYIDPELVDKDARFKEPGLKKVEGKDYDYELYIVAQAFLYSPQEVEIPKGAKVKISGTTKDVVHGFGVAGTNINMMLEPGHISTYTTTFDQPGEYLTVCNEYCGTGHTDMSTMIKVVEK
ncbi:cytochrome c oxidase subunit II [Abyssicoccus albus]|uniref:Cytochrome aa3 subunit 2 n=1 Tax=Abyssicoccus albus TaxID=1817405 RepID=A0A3N5BN48_9BACL|nr:cytochrome c oxidase subunit II [Abyssicoccus albus]RPF57999.1 cytochrome c oxidase subunit 2 [Abyssicoccus albus]